MPHDERERCVAARFGHVRPLVVVGMKADVRRQGRLRREQVVEQLVKRVLERLSAARGGCRARESGIRSSRAAS